MIIEIDDELFNKIKSLMKNRNVAIYEQLQQIKPLDTFSTDTTLKQAMFNTFSTDNTLQQAREIKTQRVKENIKETIKSLYSQNITPTKYQVHKLTNIAYVTLNKYYDEIINEVQNANE